MRGLKVQCLSIYLAAYLSICLPISPSMYLYLYLCNLMSVVCGGGYRGLDYAGLGFRSTLQHEDSRSDGGFAGFLWEAGL